MPIHNSYFISQGVLSPIDLEKSGPVVQIEIGLPPVLAAFLEKTKKPIPPPLTGKALIDTGASITAVNLEILEKLAISPISFRDVLTPAGGMRQNTYPCQISFPGTKLPSLNFNEVLGSDLKKQDYIVLLGRDVLRHFILVYNGTSGSFSLAI